MTQFTAAAVRLLGLDELQPQLSDRLRVDLADARFGHPEDLADLGEREALEVVERDDDLLALGQRVDRRGEQPARLLALEPGASGRRRGRRACPGARPARRDRCPRSGSRRAASTWTNEIWLITSCSSRSVTPEPLGDLLLGRCALVDRLEVGVRLLDLARLEPDRTRDPVHRAELVDDRALDPRDRVRLELVAPAPARTSRARRSDRTSRTRRGRPDRRSPAGRSRRGSRRTSRAARSAGSAVRARPSRRPRSA